MEVPVLERYLIKFDARIADDHYARIEAAYRAVFAWEPLEDLPFIWSDLPPVADEDWPDYAYNDTFVDREKMLLAQLRAPFLHLQAGDYYLPGIRANYGTVILPTILGAGYQLTETSMPWVRHLENRDAVRRVVEAGIPDPHAGLGRACLETAAYYRETLAPYPRLTKAVRIYHPDLQGPFDVAHLLWGPDIFLGLYDCPELVHALLDLVTRTYIAWLTQWKAFVGEGNDWTTHWTGMIRGGAMLRDDTPVMLSQAQYLEFVQPYDQRILDAFGGCIHFCGRGDQFVGPMATSANLYGLNPSQPELNDMPRLWDLTRAHGLVMMTMSEDHVPPGTVTGATLVRSYRAGQ
ncbi:MAG: hypothetical protein ACYC5M_06250 [Anaerolineae bacterium]